MNLADRPQILEGEVVARTPIVVTANNITSLYEPLRRPGRMTSFFWKMGREEILLVVDKLFRDVLAEDDIKRLASTYQEKAPAFFEQVWSEFLNLRLASTAPSLSRGTFLRKIIIDPSFSSASLSSVAPQKDKASRDEIFAVADRLGANRREE